MLHIAECTDTFLPVTDGVGRVVYEYARALSARGEAVYVVTPQNAKIGYRGGLPFEIADYYALRMPGAGERSYGLAPLDLHYLTRMDSVPLNLVHVHSPGSAGQEACRLADKYHVPLIGTFHPKYFEDVYRFVKLGALAEATVRRVAEFYLRCDEVWTISPQAAGMLKNAGYTGHVEIVPSGTDVSPVSDLQVRLTRDRFHLSDAPILLCVGQIDFSKNIERVMEAAAILAARNVRFQLLFAGIGPDEKLARTRARERGLSGIVRFLGAVADDQSLRALYRLASLNVYPSLYITAGLVVHEAAGVGTPSVVMRESAAAEPIRDGVNGFLSENDSTGLANLIEFALKDPARLAAVGAEARRTIPTDWDTVMADVASRYQALTQKERHALTIKRGPFRAERRNMDETLELRVADLVGRFLQQDLQHVYAYPNQPFHPKRLPAAGPKATSLPRATPESQGVSSRALLGLIDEIEADPAAQVTNLIVLRHGKVIAEADWTPYEQELPRELYSLSKSITSTAIGLLVDEGRLDLDERLVEIFPEKSPADPLHPCAKLTVRHLLTMSTGSYFNEVGTALGTDWVKEFLNANVKFEPGSAFEYNSMNTYMLSAIVKERSGLSLTDYLRPRLYEPLGIHSADWEVCPLGIEKGGWGLMLRAEDVAKLGQLYLNGGLWEGKRILSRAWVDEASASQIPTPNGELTYGYGYQIWRTPHEGGYLFNGAFGQYMIALPDLDVVVAALSCTARLFAQGGMMQYVDNAFKAASDAPLPEDPNAFGALTHRLHKLSVVKRVPFAPAEGLRPELGALASFLDGRVYTMAPNVGGLFPVILQSVHNNYALGLSHLTFRKEADGALALTFEEGGERNTIPFRERSYTRATVTIRGERQEVRSILWAQDLGGGNWRIDLNLHFIETPFTRRIRMDLIEDEIHLVLDESPALQDASVMLLDLAGVTKMQLVRNLMPMLQQEKHRQLLRTYTTVTVDGRL